ncbi:MAG TPA: ABC transporter ATP-binding protein [Bacillota bacterium]|nr:ABC transporter ATP-binding protein [Bacillota bacterium]
MVQLRVKDLVKEFPGGVRAVDNINFVIPPGSLFTLLGPSGCGKTTTLRLIAGLETPTSGQVFFDEEDYTSYPPFRREIGMVFQSYALFPHMTVYENVAYGLRIRNASNAEIEKRVNSALELVGLPGVSDRKPSQLSGGQQQRIALARAIVYDPKVLLLDEPLSNLDAKLRIYMRQEIKNIQETAGITTAYVTHDQEEALSISDYIAVMDSGTIAQFDKPYNVYERPSSVFVAAFIGQANFLEVEVCSLSSTGAHVAAKDGSIVEVGRIAGEKSKFRIGEKALLFFRPERVSLSKEPMDKTTLPCEVTGILFLGETTKYSLKLSHDEEVMVSVSKRLEDVGKGEKVNLLITPSDATIFPFDQKAAIEEVTK